MTARFASAPVAIVTGSSTGVGRAIAVRLAKTHCVVVNARHDAEGAEQTCFEITQAGGRASFVMADASTDAGAQEIVEFARVKYSAPAVLVNNAGATRSAAFGEWSASHWSDMLSNNLTSCALMSQSFAKNLPEEAGSIINVGSIRGTERYSRIGVAAYSAAKAGVISLTSVLARELAPRITVNCISPGFVETRYMSRADPVLKEGWLQSMPIGRFVQPAEVAEVAAWLLDQRAVTGANLIVDGGWTVTAD